MTEYKITYCAPGADTSVVRVIECPETADTKAFRANLKESHGSVAPDILNIELFDDNAAPPSSRNGTRWWQSKRWSRNWNRRGRNCKRLPPAGSEFWDNLYSFIVMNSREYYSGRWGELPAATQTVRPGYIYSKEVEPLILEPED